MFTHMLSIFLADRKDITILTSFISLGLKEE